MNHVQFITTRFIYNNNKLQREKSYTNVLKKQKDGFDLITKNLRKIY